jgi:hypothetical protein
MSEKWWDMSDDELDDLFREASDKVDVPFDSSAFDKLRHKMESPSSPETANRFKKRWLLPLLGLLLLVGVGLVYRLESSKEVGLSNENAEVSNKIIENSDKKNNTLSSENQKVAKNSTTDNLAKLSVSPSQKTDKTIVNNNTSGSSVETQTRAEGTTEASTQINSEQKANLKPNLSSPINTQATSKGLAQKSNNLSEQNAKPKPSLSSVKSIGTHSHTTGGELVQKSNDLSEQKENVTPRLSFEEKQKTVEESAFKNTEIQSQETEENKIKNNSYSSENQNDVYSLTHTNTFRKSKQKPQKTSSSDSKTTTSNPSNQGQNVFVTPMLFAAITEKTEEEAIVKNHFYDVDYLNNKNTKSLSTEIQPVDIQPFADSLPRKILMPKFSRFGISLGLSPDFNSIESLETSVLGTSIGLFFEYRISKKLTLQTGISYSKKVYVGEYDYYHNWPFPSKAHPTKPIDVDGGCTIYDLPINLRLNVFQKPKQTWFITGGVSSYLMAKENYTFNYDPATATPPKDWAWADNSKFMFSVLNFSMGWEKQVSNHFHIQLEPFVKTPLSGVGRGGVNLYSSGLLFSTKYEF